MSDVKIAVRSAVVVIDGKQHRVRRNRSLADAGHPVVEARPELWRKLTIDFPVDDDTPAAGAAPQRPTSSATRSAWEKYAVALGADPEVVAGQATKGDVVALADKLAGG